MHTRIQVRARRGLLLPLLLLSAAPAAFAQLPAGAVVQTIPDADDPAEKLAQALRTLATEPNNIAALTAAGTNALALGDPNAAVGFFGRAAGIAPGDGPVKAGLGSALVQLEKPQDGLRLFAEASRLGVADVDLAEDRGLAYDLTGDPRRAQKDYALVLAAHPDDDVVRRRLALSQGISGDRAAAIATLDPLIRKRDIAAWRDQTFVLAMNGDAKGAGDITHIMMPSQADMLQPFLVRLSSLSPPDKARAVHFGEMPQAGSSYSATQLATLGTTPTYADRPAAPAPVAVATPPARSARPAATPAIAAPAPVPALVRPVAIAGNAAPLADIALGTTPPEPAAVSRAAPSVDETARVIAKPVAAPRAAPVVEEPAQGIAKPAVAPPVAPQPIRIARAEPAPTPIPARFVGPVAPAAGPTPAEIATGMPASPPAEPAAPSPLPAVSAPAAASTAALPMPSASVAGHYDLPHVAAERSGGRPVEASASVAVAAPAAPLSAPPATAEKTIGTPVVHIPAGETKAEAPAPKAPEKPAEARSVDGKSSPVEKVTAPARAAVAEDVARKASKPAAAGPASTGKAKATKPASADEEASTTTSIASSRKTKTSADTDADDRTIRSAGKSSPTSRKGKSAKAADETDGDAPAKGRDAKGKSARLAAAEKEKPSSRAKGKSSGKDADDEDASSTSRHGKGASKSAKARPAEEKAPERVYVQVAGGANKADMDKAWDGVKKKAPELMKGHNPSTTPLKATNRLLVGPFKTDDEAQAFVNKMAGKGLSGFTFKSAKGQKVEKVDPDK